MVRRRVMLVGVFVALICAVVRAEVKPGDKGPDFDLFGVDYKYHSLGDHPDSKATVVVFTCNHCPVAKDYEDTLINIAKTYQPKGIQLLAINPNPADKVPADGFPEMVKRAKEKRFPFPYLYGERQRVARAYGATCTPHVFIVGPEGTIVYTGAVDNHHKEPNYLSDALDDILAGRRVRRSKTAQFGCSVKYRKKPKEKAKKASTLPGETITVAAGETFTIKLPANPTTGYQWIVSQAPVPGVAELVSSEYRARTPGLLGAGGVRVFTFKAVARGATRIELEYRRAWEKNVEPAQRARYVLVVE